MINKVHVSLGQKVKKGDLLFDLFATELAAAVNDYQTGYIQWQQDLKNNVAYITLSMTGDLAEQDLVDAQNRERKSRLAFTTSKERLRVWGVQEDQINSLINDHGNLPKQQQDNNDAAKGNLPLLAPIDGIVIQLDVVPGNHYDRSDVLMAIAPLGHFLVWVNVPKTDAAQVKEGQACDVFIPFRDQPVITKVDWISKQESRDKPGTVLIWMTIPNPEDRLKADTSVRVRIRPVSPTGQRPDKG
jgi:multidrug resistance efflux pump